MPIHKVVESLTEATTIIVDLRNFTQNLNASREGDDGINAFCHFLSGFYADCLDACLLALPTYMRNIPPLYMCSTGDGALIVFLGEWHFGYGFLAGITLNATLNRRCYEYNQEARENKVPGTTFGIGIESGKVSRIYAYPMTNTKQPIVDTYIGNCINIAARAEGISKTLYHANTIFSDTTVELVAESLFGRRFQELRRRETQVTDDRDRLAIHDEMNKLNHDLCLSYINRHILKGVEQPMPLYRLARSAVLPGIPRFNDLLNRLVRYDKDHFTQIFEYLQHLNNVSSRKT